MKNIHLLMILLAGIYGCPLHGRAQTQIRPLSIGDTLSDLSFHQVINYEKDSVRLSDFKGKLLVFDFWNTWCSACLASFPKLERLQAKFGDRLVIMPVVSHKGGNRQKYLDFYNLRRERQMPINLPSIVEDTILVRFFPHGSLPHVVWVDDKGGVRGITKGTELKEENIINILENQDFTLVHRDSADAGYAAYDRKKPFLLDGNGGEQHDFMQRSILAKDANVKQGGNLYIDRDSAHTRVSLMGTMLHQLFTQAFMHRYHKEFNGAGGRYVLTGKYLKKQLICETSSGIVAGALALANGRDPYRYVANRPTYYSYELILPGKHTDNDMLDAMIADLNRIFNVHVRIETRKIPVLELYRMKSGRLNHTRYPQQRSSLIIDKVAEGLKFVVTNNEIQAIVTSLNRRLAVPFIIDRTALSGSFDMDLELKSIADARELDTALKAYGLRLRKTKKKLDVLVFGD